MGESENSVTLKALANISPGFALKPWVQKCPRRFFATLKGLRFGVNKRRRNSFRVAPSRNQMRLPRVAKAQPWAGIGERFQRYSFLLNLSKVRSISTFGAKPYPNKKKALLHRQS